MSDADVQHGLCSALDALQITGGHASSVDPSRSLGSAQSTLQAIEHDSFERMAPVWKQLASLGVPKSLITFRPEVLDLLDIGPLPVPGLDVSLEQMMAEDKAWEPKDALIADEHRRVVEGLSVWYKDNMSQLAPKTRSRIKTFFERARYFWDFRTVNWGCIDYVGIDSEL